MEECTRLPGYESKKKNPKKKRKIQATKIQGISQNFVNVKKMQNIKRQLSKVLNKLRQTDE